MTILYQLIHTASVNYQKNNPNLDLLEISLFKYYSKINSATIDPNFNYVFTRRASASLSLESPLLGVPPHSVQRRIFRMTVHLDLLSVQAKLLRLKLLTCQPVCLLPSKSTHFFLSGKHEPQCQD